LDVESDSSCGSLIASDPACIAAGGTEEADESADDLPTFEAVEDAPPSLFRFDGAGMLLLLQIANCKQQKHRDSDL